MREPPVGSELARRVDWLVASVGPPPTEEEWCDEMVARELRQIPTRNRAMALRWGATEEDLAKPWVRSLLGAVTIGDQFLVQLVRPVFIVGRKPGRPGPREVCLVVVIDEYERQRAAAPGRSENWLRGRVAEALGPEIRRDHVRRVLEHDARERRDLAKSDAAAGLCELAYREAAIAEWRAVLAELPPRDLCGNRAPRSGLFPHTADADAPGPTLRGAVPR